jgi:hypothetical protein
LPEPSGLPLFFGESVIVVETTSSPELFSPSVALSVFTFDVSDSCSVSIAAAFLGLPLDRGVIFVVVDACLVHLIRHCRLIAALQSMKVTTLPCYPRMDEWLCESQQSRLFANQGALTMRYFTIYDTTTSGHLQSRRHATPSKFITPSTSCTIHHGENNLIGISSDERSISSHS